jgi:TonB-dependent starch-binding outer membrane protein SusC
MRKFCFTVLLCIAFFNTYAQQTLSGTVVDADDNLPLQGAVIIIKNSSKNTITDKEGKFLVTITDAQKKEGIVIINYVGHFKQELRIANKNSILVRLVKSSAMDEVVVNSYSKPKRKEEVIGSISTVSAEQLQTNRPIESFDKMLEGLVPGVQVQTNTELGTPVTINIRGQNSLSNLNSSNRTALTTSSQPLYVVDGIPIIEQRRGAEPIAFLNDEQLLNPIAGINPDDIESISVLKDAAATAIYGANANNGVIIITTKKGKAGKTRLNVSYSTGQSSPINQIRWLTGPEYKSLVKEQYLNLGRSPFDAELLSGSGTINTNWFGLTNQYGVFNNVDFDASGGSENTTFRFSASYQQQQAMQKGNDFEKIFFTLRVDHKVGNKFNISVKLAPSITNKNGLNVYSNVPIIPNVPAYNADGSFYELGNLNVPNPLAILEQNENKHTGGTFDGNINLSYAVKPNFRLTSVVGINAFLNKQSIYFSADNATGSTRNGFMQIFDRQNFGWITFHQANWSPKIKDHTFDFTAGFEAQSQTTRLLKGSGTGFNYDRVRELSMAQNQLAASSNQISKTASGYIQMIYNYAGKYFFNATTRSDAASIFGTDINSTINAGAGFSWLASNEQFIKSIKWIDMLRVRFSYGTTGNSRIGSYEARGIFTISSPSYGGLVGATPTSAPNDLLSWEKGNKTNIGIDFNFKKRFQFTLDFYNNITDDAISTVAVPFETGFTGILANTAKLRNRGFDAGIQAKLFTGKFRWTSNFNFGYNKGIVVAVNNGGNLFSSTERAGVLKAGVSTTAIWGFTFTGINPANGAPQYLDKEGKPIEFNFTNSAANAPLRSMQNAYYLGDRLPTLQGGFINTFGYKEFSITLNIIYSIGGKDLIDYNLEADGNNLTNRNGSINLLNRWNTPGQVTNVGKLTNALPIVNSTRYLYDATFIKLGNITASYTLPNKIKEKIKGINASVFFNITNVLYWYAEKSPNGRNGYREYRFSNFPEARTITSGIKINL